jgi:hypothetical protein
MLSLRVREPACTLVSLSLRTTSGCAARLGRVNAAHRHGPSGREFPTERSRIPAAFAFAWEERSASATWALPPLPQSIS